MTSANVFATVTVVHVSDVAIVVVVAAADVYVYCAYGNNNDFFLQKVRCSDLPLLLLNSERFPFFHI
jgi:hypothetical protein